MKSSLMRLNFSPINNRQEDLAHLVLELHRIPPKPFKRWNVCPALYSLIPYLLILTSKLGRAICNGLSF